MHESLAPWTTFYTIIGAAAATLTGLMFVMITLVVGTRLRRRSEGIAAFSTPTIVHYCVALAVAAILVAPWRVLWHAGVMVGLVGLGGLAYALLVTRRMRGQTIYRPVLEDWLWHAAFPLVSYVAIVVAAVFLSSYPASMLFFIGAGTMMLLFIGIHNAWDNVTYIIVEQTQFPDESPDKSAGAGEPHTEQTHPIP